MKKKKEVDENEDEGEDEDEDEDGFNLPYAVCRVRDTSQMAHTRAVAVKPWVSFTATHDSDDDENDNDENVNVNVDANDNSATLPPDWAFR